MSSMRLNQKENWLLSGIYMALTEMPES